MAEYYVDFSAGVDGSGTSPLDPYNTVIGKSLSGRVWIRRKGFLALSAILDINFGAPIIGWPLPGDDYYDIRTPCVWDSDPGTYAVFTNTNANNYMAIPNHTSPGTGNWPTEIHRIKFWGQDSGSGGSEARLVDLYRPVTFKNCLFTSYGRNAVTVTVPDSFVNSPKFYNCTFEVHHAGPGTFNGSCVNFADVTAPIFENCTFTVDDVNSNGLQPGIGSYTKFAPVFRKCTFQSSTSFNYLILLNSTSVDPVTFIDCIINTTGASGTQAMWTQTKVCHINTIFRGDWAKIENIDRYQHFAEYTQAGGKAYGLYAHGAGTIHLDNPSFGAANTTNIDKSSTILLYINGATLTGYTPIYARDMAAIDDFHQYSVEGEVLRSSVYRSGGYGFSLKFLPNGTINGPLIYGRPGSEMLFVKLPAGTWTVTYYGAYKTYAPTANDIWFDIEYYDSTNTHRAYKSSKIVAALTSDASVWNGDTSLTPFKLQITLTNTRFAIVPVRLYTNKFDAAGYFYIDSLPSVN